MMRRNLLLCLVLLGALILTKAADIEPIEASEEDVNQSDFLETDERDVDESAEMDMDESDEMDTGESDEMDTEEEDVDDSEQSEAKESDEQDDILGGCGAYWLQWKHLCFRMTLPGTYSEGVRQCKGYGRGSQIASILTAEEQYLVRTHFHRELIWSPYIGLSGKLPRKDEKRVFKWIDGSTYKYTAWDRGAGEPNNRDTVTCTQMNKYRNYLWMDTDCKMRSVTLCKKDLRPPTRPPTINPNLVAYCDNGWSMYKESCFRLLTNPVTTDQGKKACMALGKGSQLASIVDVGEQDFVANTFKKYRKSILIGLIDQGRSRKYGKSARRYWAWLDATPYKFSAWYRTQPENSGLRSWCTEMRMQWGYQWNDVSCTTRNAALCKRPVGRRLPTKPPPPVVGCGKGWSTFGKTCFRLTPKEGTLVDGKVACKAMGGGSFVASILSAQEQNHVARAYNNFRKPILIGLFDVSKTKQQGRTARRGWRWEDRKPYKYSAWYKNEPNNGNGNQWCVSIWKYTGFKWYDNACDRKYVALCRKTIK